MGGPLCVWGLQGLKPGIGFGAFEARVNSCPDKKLNPSWVVNWVIQVERIRQFSELASATRGWQVSKSAVTIAHEVSFLRGSATPVEDQKETEVQVPQNIGAEKRPGAKARFMLAFDSGA